jgi:hypothetical protein
MTGDVMTWRDKLELGLKDDAAFRKDNLPPEEVRGPEEAAGPGRSPVIVEARDEESPNRDGGTDGGPPEGDQR